VLALASGIGWERVERIFAIIGGIAALIVVVGVIITGLERIPQVQRRHEESKVGQLVPGQDYTRVLQSLGEVPHYHQRLRSGRTLYVFDRRWEYLQFLVDDSGRVLSIGVYAKTRSFKPRLYAGSASFILNRDSLSGYSSGAIDMVGAAGFCMASNAAYVEGYRLSHVDEFRSIIAGWMEVTQTHDDAPVCEMLGDRDSPCSALAGRPPGQTGLSVGLINCVKRSAIGREVQARLIPSVVIVTAPNQTILPDMLVQPLLGGIRPFGILQQASAR
jgi:hypothetical protein